MAQGNPIRQICLIAKLQRDVVSVYLDDNLNLIADDLFILDKTDLDL